MDCTLIDNSSFFFKVFPFLRFFDEHGHNFDDVSKNGYSRPS